MKIVDQFREYLKDVPRGTVLKAEDIVEKISERYGTSKASIKPRDYCYNVSSEGSSKNHVSFFLNIEVGTSKPFKYVGENFNCPTIAQVIAAYKNDFQRVDMEERYKWKALAHYKEHWNIEAPDFAGMLKEALAKCGNILTAGHYQAYQVICGLAEYEPETVRGLFKMLYDEDAPLLERYTEFKDGCDVCLKRYNADPSHKQFGRSDQNAHAISVYLAFEHPDKNYIYKSTAYHNFAALIGKTLPSVALGEYEMEAYNHLCDEVLSEIKADVSLQKMSRERFDKDYDESFHLLATDIIYFGHRLVMGDRKETADIGKNTILYGPPGTGKTYNTALYAVAIIENRPLENVKQEDYKDVRKRYQDYREQGLIEFTTFRQSYGYEEFIEGIKPVMDDDAETGDIKYQIAPGVFKAFCDRANPPITENEQKEFGLNEAPTVWKVTLGGPGKNNVRTYCMKNGCIRIGCDQYEKSVRDEIDFSIGGAKVVNALVNQMQIGDLVLSYLNSTTIDAIGVVAGEYETHEFSDGFKRVRKVNWIVKDIEKNIVELNGGKTMARQTMYRLNIPVTEVMNIIKKHKPSNEPTGQNTKNYVFIIDEINRGNISKIFGELITLIEPAKRLGQDEALTARLPYSGTSFGVPDNVYILGTMNTADRSIAMLDTALRRRFQFVEMMPDTALLGEINIDGISVEKLLERINQRIEALYDRDHTIGHSYFLGLQDNSTIEDLAEVFRNSIIPLLQEYFYEDYENIRLVLWNDQKGPDEQFIKEIRPDTKALFGSADIDREVAPSYKINEDVFTDPDAYRGIYEAAK